MLHCRCLTPAGSNWIYPSKYTSSLHTYIHIIGAMKELIFVGFFLFSINYFSYTNKDSIRQKLTYAIHNCIAIDGDSTSAGRRYE
jgi:hypothetical protein